MIKTKVHVNNVCQKKLVEDFVTLLFLEVMLQLMLRNIPKASHNCEQYEKVTKKLIEKNININQLLLADKILLEID